MTPGAEENLRSALQESPNSAFALFNLANFLAQAGRITEAIELYRRAIAVKPDFVEATNNLGYVLRSAGDLEAAAAAFRRMTQISPRFFGGYCNLGIVLTELGRFDEAITVLGQAIELDPAQAEPHYALGNAFWDQHRFPSAAASYQEAVLLNPNHASAHYNLARTLLALGDYQHGWPEYEWRAQARPRFWFPPQSLPKPQWDGRPLDRRTIFLHAEQGLGDTLQFVRYAPLVAERGGRVLLCCPAELVRLLRTVKGVDLVTPLDDPPKDYDFHCPLMSLPLAFGTEVSTIPAAVPYINADPQLVEQWKSRIAPSPRLKVGLVWAGSPGFRPDRSRSSSLSDFARLANIPNVEFFSLQKGDAAAQAASQPLPMIDWTNQLNDFADTAALVANLDLVIAVDTAVAHLAAGMGKPTWLLIAKNPDWRWLLDRTDSPWYPTVRLFRQTTPGNWGSVLSEVAQSPGQPHSQQND